MSLKRWDIDGKLKVHRTLGNHRRYRLSDVEAFLGMSEVNQVNTKNAFIYARVSTKKQAESGTLQRQKEKLEPNQEMVQDLVSIITCFSAKIYGAKGGRKIKKTLEELEKERQEEHSENNYESNANKCNQ